jgi:hypothetical protein
MTEKIIGYILLALGIIIILSAGVSVFSVLTRSSKPIQFIPAAAVTSEASVPKTQTIQGVEVQMPSINEMVGISADSLVFITNLTIHLFLMGFIVNVGFKVASLGVQLVRPIIVDLKAKGLTTS